MIMCSSASARTNKTSKDENIKAESKGWFTLKEREPESDGEIGLAIFRHFVQFYCGRHNLKKEKNFFFAFDVEFASAQCKQIFRKDTELTCVYEIDVKVTLINGTSGRTRRTRSRSYCSR